MSNKKLRKIGKKLLVGASSSIVAGLLIAGTASNVFADTTDYSPNTTYEQSTGQTGMHMMHRWNSHTKAGGLAVQLGLDKEKIKQEIKSGKTMKQILQEHGIVPGQLQKAFQSENKPQWKRKK
jgi:hypothetical protein